MKRASAAMYERTARMYRETHGGADAPPALVQMLAPSPHEDMAELGGLFAIEYLTIKNTGPEAGKLAIHRHVFKASAQPVLAFNTSGGLLILGGGYTVTARGIVG